MTLPSFKAYTQIFQSNHDICRALCLFFADILDFYLVLLNFVTNPRRNTFIEALWPNIRSNITKIQENMDHHKAIMTTNVTLQDILLAHQARKRALEEYEQAQTFRDNQTFSTIRNEINPHDYYTELSSILRHSSVTSGGWLKDEPHFLRWYDPLDRTTRSMCLYGIPGSGKTFITGNLIKSMQDLGQQVVFAFLSHNNRAAGNTIKVLHSFLFQLLEFDPLLRPFLHGIAQRDYRKLKNDEPFVIDLLCKVFKSTGPSFIILDGLDELDERSWGHLLTSLFKINDNCPETKILISSREERGITLQLNKKAIPLRIDRHNSKDIELFIELECEGLIFEMRALGADENTCLEIKRKVNKISERAAGMFIYARLVILMVKDQGNIHDIEAQIENLPDGLDEVYGRLLDRVKNKLSRSARATVRNVLQWVACAQRPLREEEMLQVLAIEPGQQDFTKGRKQFHDIRKMCGPIIEFHDGNIQFVHFSVKEYLLHEQSDSFLNLFEAHTNAAITCTTYLSFESLDPLFSLQTNHVAELRKGIVDGDWVLFEYASAAFLEHLKALENQNDAPDRYLLIALNRLREVRFVGSLDVSCVPKNVIYMFRRFTDWPDVQSFLSLAGYFDLKAQLGIPSEENILDFPVDPLGSFSARHKLRQGLEDIICQGPDDLEHLYGRNVYHCDQPFCHAYRCGFESEKLRDQHSSIHKRPHKCPEPGCLFTDIGFCDVSELDRHICTVHLPHTLLEDTPSIALSPGQPLSDTLKILEDAVTLDQVDTVKRMLHGGVQLLEDNYQRFEIVLTAASLASTEILSDLLTHWVGNTPSLEKLLATALDSENLPNIGFLLSRGARMSDQIGLARSIVLPMSLLNKYSYEMSGYVRALSLWNPSLMAYLIDECHIDLPVKVEKPGMVFCYGASETTEDQARERFNGIKKYIIWPEAYVEGVHMATKHDFLLGARICLENGGDPNWVAFEKKSRRRQDLLDKMTAFELVVRYGHGNKESAPLVKVLLQHGVDPEPIRRKLHRNSTAVKKIAGRFGTTWEDMIRRIQEGEDLALRHPLL
ncbi:hypothetical protein F5B19DRAFT_453335 [Rostrohypoxylon terebratum]|nr:hypothetical protein F5B19DRAFT_453335 [Rostrohypoxylon terebratum]